VRVHTWCVCLPVSARWIFGPPPHLRTPSRHRKNYRGRIVSDELSVWVCPTRTSVPATAAVNRLSIRDIYAFCMFLSISVNSHWPFSYVPRKRRAVRHPAPATDVVIDTLPLKLAEFTGAMPGVRLNEGEKAARPSKGSGCVVSRTSRQGRRIDAKAPLSISTTFLRTSAV
jgi:hypothetical protein